MSRAKLAALLLLIMVIPVAYLSALNRLIPNSRMEFQTGWADDSFQPSDWTLSTLSTNTPVDANLTSENGALKISASGNVSAGTLVAAQRLSGLDFNLTEYRYLKVSVMTSGLYVAARIVIWTNGGKQINVVLLKTYNDKEWHTEILDVVYALNVLGASTSQLYMIELSWQQVTDGSNSTVYYSKLSFNSLETA